MLLDGRRDVARLALLAARVGAEAATPAVLGAAQEAAGCGRRLRRPTRLDRVRPGAALVAPTGGRRRSRDFRLPGPPALDACARIRQACTAAEVVPHLRRAWAVRPVAAERIVREATQGAEAAVGRVRAARWPPAAAPPPDVAALLADLADRLWELRRVEAATSGTAERRVRARVRAEAAGLWAADGAAEAWRGVVAVADGRRAVPVAVLAAAAVACRRFRPAAVARAAVEAVRQPALPPDADPGVARFLACPLATQRLGDPAAEGGLYVPAGPVVVARDPGGFLGVEVPRRRALRERLVAGFERDVDWLVAGLFACLRDDAPEAGVLRHCEGARRVAAAFMAAGTEAAWLWAADADEQPGSDDDDDDAG